MNIYSFDVSFSTGVISSPYFTLVVNDHNSTTFKFTFDQDGRHVFKLLYPDNTYYVQDIINDELILGKGVLNQNGNYKFEISLYGEDNRLTTSLTQEFAVRLELVDTDEIVSVDDRVPVLDNLIEETNTILQEAKDGKFDGATFTPNVSESGDLSWSNDKGKENPPTVNIMGPPGEPGAVKMQVVDVLPETGETDTIYLVKKDIPNEQNLYDEYVYANGTWEHIGDTSVDLSDYYTKSETDNKLNEKQNTLTAGENITIDENNVISSGKTNYLGYIEDYTPDNRLDITDLEKGTYSLGIKDIIGSQTLYLKVSHNGQEQTLDTKLQIEATVVSNMIYFDVRHPIKDISGYDEVMRISFSYLNSITGEIVNTKYGISYNNTSGILSNSARYNTKISAVTTDTTQTIRDKKTFDVLPESSVEPTNDNQFVNKKYVDDNKYKLPIASVDTLGGIKIGENLSIDENGVVSASGINTPEFFIDIPSVTINTSNRFTTYTLSDDFNSQLTTIINNIFGTYQKFTVMFLVNFVLAKFKPSVMAYSDGRGTSTLGGHPSQINLYAVIDSSTATSATGVEPVTFGGYIPLTLTIYPSWDGDTALVTKSTFRMYGYSGTIPSIDYMRGKTLFKDNATSFTPTKDYHPATKKYVDDNKYALPIASADTLGGIKLGEGLSADENGVVSASGGNDSVPTLYIYTNMSNNDIGFKYYGSTDEPTITLNEFLKKKTPFFNIMLVYNSNSTYSGTNIIMYPNWKPTDNIYDGNRGNLRFYSDVYYTPKGDNDNVGQGILVDVDTDLQKDDNGNVYVTFFRITTHALNYLSKNNASTYIPTGDYNPATKKYVDDSKVTKSGVLEYLEEENIYILTLDNNINNGASDISNGLNGTKDEEICGYFAEILNKVFPKKSGTLILNIINTGYSSNFLNNGVFKWDYGSRKFYTTGIDTFGCRINYLDITFNTNTDGTYNVTRVKLAYNPIKSSYTPTDNDHLTNKKYVDDKPTTYTGYDATKTQILKNINGTLTWVDET